MNGIYYNVCNMTMLQHKGDLIIDVWCTIILFVLELALAVNKKFWGKNSQKIFCDEMVKNNILWQDAKILG